MTKQVVCIRWGAKYGADYVNRLHGMLTRHLAPPFRLTCFTDDAAGLCPEIDSRPLPPLGAEAAPTSRGIWGKSRLWAAELEGVGSPFLFLDLDVVITGPMDGFFTHGAPSDVILARNPNTPLERLGQTSIYRMPVGALAPLREAFLADPQGTADRFRFEQRYVSRMAPNGVRFWPKGWVAVFKWHCVPPFPLNYARTPRLPEGTRIVLFPGPLNPPDAIAGRWREGMESAGPRDHLRAMGDGRRIEPRWRHLRHYLRPAPWVAEHWRE